jgi:spore photoproduct lyase
VVFGIKRVLQACDDSTPFVRGIVERLRRVPVERGPAPDLEIAGKETLELSPFPGEPLKKCPGTKGYICCGYRILHLGANCPMDCSYCILQAYLDQPYLRVFTNLDEKLAALAARLDAHPEAMFRVGTGEFMDSLALDPVVAWTDRLLPFFKERKNAVLELKTKSIHIERVLKSPVRDRIVVSWSLNSPDMAEREEHGAPSIRRRLEAAKRCQEEGFVLGFHFDPLVPHQGWKDGYMRTLDLLANAVDPRGIIWVSLGCMRYLPELKPIIRRRRPESRVLDGEFVLGLDGKMRLFKPIRIELVRSMAESLERWHRDLGLYLCMESPDVWEQGLGWSPAGSEGLSRFLDDRVKRFFG